MTEESPSTVDAPDGVVVGVDGSPQARQALAWAADEADVRAAGLLVVGVAPSPPDQIPAWSPRTPTSVRRGRPWWMTPSASSPPVTPPCRSAARCGGAPRPTSWSGPDPRPTCWSLVPVEPVGSSVCWSARWPTDASTGPGARWPWSAPGPTGGSGRTGGRVVVGIDGSHDTRVALRWALEEARVRHAVLEAVIAWQYPPTHAVVATSALRFTEAAETVGRQARRDAARWAPGVAFTVTVADEAVVPALLARSREASLLVVGPHRQGGYRDLLLGSVAHQCAHHATCPVVVVQGRDLSDAESGGREGTVQAPAGAGAP